MEIINIKQSKGYTIKIGQKHRYHAITNCKIFEVSTPEIGTTYRLEDDYNRPNESEELRNKERK